MIGTLIYLILVLIVIGVIYWGCSQLLPLIPLPEPIRVIVNVLLVIILVIVVVYALVALLRGAGMQINAFGL